MSLCIPRKRHECRVCGHYIKAGEPCIRWSGVIDGQGYFTSHAHPICARFMNASRHDDWECIFPGDYTRSDVHDWEYNLLMGNSKRP